jgi:hypothetical protein
LGSPLFVIQPALDGQVAAESHHLFAYPLARSSSLAPVDEIYMRVLATRVTFETLPKGGVSRHATLGL